MKQYNVTGMSCAACSARVEKAVGQLDGVTSCSVNLLTNSMGVEGDVSAEAVIKAVENAGYGASVKGEKREAKKANTVSEEESVDRNTSIIKKRLIASIIVLCVLMYFSMGHMMFGLPLPALLAENPLALGLVQLLLSAIVLVINQRFFISGFLGMMHGSPNMDTLVALGSGASFVYSTYALFAMSDALMRGDVQGAFAYVHDLYFESAAMILTLITVGKMLESRAKGKTTNALKSLLALAPKSATLLVDGQEVVVEIERVQVGDEFVVRAGEHIPVDGIILEGSAAIDESALTGESMPVDKKCGDKVSAATTNQSGYLRCKATRVGEDTALAQIIQMVTDASATKAPIAQIADKVSGVFVPAVLLIAVVTFVVWLLVGESLGFAIARAISVLVISCPCALGLATPVAIMVGNGVAARKGILFKTAVSLEATGKSQIIVLDKTGTITSGKPKVTDIYPLAVSKEELLAYAYTMEAKSNHPLAYAIIEKAKADGITAYAVEDYEVVAGNGISCTYQKELLYAGKKEWIDNVAPSALSQADVDVEAYIEKVSKEGKTPLLFVKGEVLLGIIAVADVLREDSKEAIARLKEIGLSVVMLTGDNAITAQAIGKEAGVDEVIADVLPDGKEQVIRQLKEKGKVAMVGDGINDAPALTRADVGIAIGAGTDVAIDAADVVLMKSRLMDVVDAILLSRATLKNIKENLFFAFIYNIIGIPLAAGVWYKLFAWKLNPMFGAAAMSLSSFCVVSNALRLNWFGNKKKEVVKMEKTMHIEGMMCPHCSGRVQEALSAVAGVESAVVSHESGTAVVTLAGEVADAILQKTVEDAGYKVTGIE